MHVPLVLRFYRELWGAGRPEIAFELFAPDYVRRDLRPGDPLPGPEGQIKIATAFRRAFPDLRVSIDLIVADFDFVVVRWTMSGTHSGPWGSIAPTGRHATFSGVNFFRFANEQVVELWNHRDDLGLMQQLGVPVDAGVTNQPG